MQLNDENDFKKIDYEKNGANILNGTLKKYTG
jgi:hypothetical protein